MLNGINGDLVVGRTPGGLRFKAYLYGQPYGHLQDWRGMNMRLKALRGQPNLGFATAEEAFAFACKTFPTEAAFEQWGRRCGPGSFVTEARFKSLAIREIDWKDGAWLLRSEG